MSHKRSKDPVFASSAAIRGFINEPLALTRLRLGLSQPRPFGNIVKSLASIPELSKTDAYENEVKPLVESIISYYTPCTADQLQALTTTTLDEPTYYRHKNHFHYHYNPDDSTKAQPACFESWGDESWVEFTDLVDKAVDNLAARHRAAADGAEETLAPSPGGLVRVAWIPRETWDQFFKEGNMVIFRAPMSASVVPQWNFLEQRPAFQASHVPVLLQFDATTARRAACLSSHEPPPISVFGAMEDEWLVPRNLLCYVEKIESERSGKRSSTGQEVQATTLRSLHKIRSLPALFDKQKAPTRELLNAAILIGCGLAAKLPGGNVTDEPLLCLLRRFFETFGRALDPIDPSRVSSDIQITLADNLKTGLQYVGFLPIFVAAEIQRAFNRGYVPDDTGIMELCGYGKESWINDDNTKWKSARQAKQSDRESALEAKTRSIRKAQSSTIRNVKSCEALVEKLKLETVSQEMLADTMKGLEFSPTSLPDEFIKYAENFVVGGNRHASWCALLAICNYASKLMAPSPDLKKLFKAPYPFERWAQLGFFEAASSVGNALWAPSTETGSKAGLEAFAWEDVLRASLSTIRMLVLMGSPDAGKTTFLKHVYNVDAVAGLSEEGRTDSMSFYEHPCFDREQCAAYVVDTPGYGDAVATRNDTVRLASTCARALPGTCSAVWVMPAGRALNSVADDLFKLVLPIVNVVVVTKIDKLLADRWEELGAQLFERLGDRYTEEVADVKRRELMEGVKQEIENRIDTLCESSETPAIVYMVLSPSSWAFAEIPTGKGKGKGKQARTPEYWDSAKEDVSNMFNLQSAQDLRRNLDAMMGME